MKFIEASIKNLVSGDNISINGVDLHITRIEEDESAGRYYVNAREILPSYQKRTPLMHRFSFSPDFKVKLFYV